VTKFVEAAGFLLTEPKLFIGRMFAATATFSSDDGTYI